MKNCPTCANRIMGSSGAWGYQRCRVNEMCLDEAAVAASKDTRPAEILHNGKRWFRKDLVETGECGAFCRGKASASAMASDVRCQARRRAKLRQMATMAPRVPCPGGCGRTIHSVTNEGKRARSCPHCKRKAGLAGKAGDER